VKPLTAEQILANMEDSSSDEEDLLHQEHISDDRYGLSYKCYFIDLLLSSLISTFLNVKYVYISI